MKSWPSELCDPAGPERVGVLLRDGTSIELKNVSMTPENGFIVDVTELIPHLGETVSTWHTHPRGGPSVSADDLAFFRRWPDLTHWIVSPRGAAEYEIEDGEILCK